MKTQDFWLLDLDGTILTVEESYVHETMETVGDALDRQFTPEEAVAIWYGRDGLRNDILDQYGIESQTFWSAFHDLESPEERAAATYLHPDAEAITELENPRGVVTHCQPYLVEPILDHLDIRDWFDTVVTCSDEIGWKPDPAPVNLAMDRLNVNGGHGALVGDSIADIQAARATGMHGIFVDRDGIGALPEADQVIQSLEELV